MNVHFARITLSIRVAVLTLLLLLSSVWSPGLSKTDHQLTIDPWVQLGKLTASDGAQQDWFGSATAISADTIVIGTAGDDAEQGSAYVFVKPVGGWTAMTETAKLTASDGAALDWFGYSVAMDGDIIVVGAPGGPASSPSVVPGSAYIFVKPSSGWVDMTETAKLTASDGAINDRFGYSVAMSGDTTVVGAIYSQGSAYVFVKPTESWANMTETAKLTPSDGEVFNMFGSSTAISGDTIVVGASCDDIDGNIDQGSAYVFLKPSGGWADTTQTAKLTASDGATDDSFGWSAAIGGDTLVVGANSDATGANSQQGSAYVFVKPGGGWADMTQTAKLTASDGAAGDWFGSSVALDGDTVVVGASFNDIDANDDQGSAYAFSKPGGGWADMTETALLTASDGAADDALGWSVAISGTTLVSGAYVDNIGANENQGSTYVFYFGPLVATYLPLIRK